MNDLTWHDVRTLGVEGKGWADTAGFYERLPARAKGLVRDPVWELSRNATGLCAHFETDAIVIAARWTLTGPLQSLAIMAVTGTSGLDLYAHAGGGGGGWRWVNCFAPTSQDSVVQIPDLLPGSRRFRLYLPLFNIVEKLEIGVPPGAAWTPVPPRTDRPIVFYGTSIVHGAAASRPGMGHPQILGRRLDRPIVNLGFSGQGVMEAEVADLLAELDPCVYVIDCLPNMEGELVRQRAEPLVRKLRAARAETPIVLVEDRPFTNADLFEGRRERHSGCRRELRAAFERCTTDGVAKLHYVEGEHLLGDDHEATVDGSHPTDLGFFRMADAIEPVLRMVLD
jgi:lysophospholipase L1-like esterase